MHCGDLPLQVPFGLVLQKTLSGRPNSVLVGNLRDKNGLMMINRLRKFQQAMQTKKKDNDFLETLTSSVKS